MFEPRQKKVSTVVGQKVRPRQNKRSDVGSRPLQALQRALGNEAFGVLQAKMTLGQPGDKYENEADDVARKVMSMQEPHVQRQGEVEEEDEELQAKPLAGQITPLVRRQEVPEGDEEERLPARLDGQVLREVEEEDEEPVQAKAGTNQTAALDGGTEGRIQGLRGRGQPLDDKTRAFMEPRFEYSFANVRVHAGGEAAGLARGLSARAFTVGTDVVLGAGQYAPGSGEGRRLLAHELTHVVQQELGRKATATKSTCATKPPPGPAMSTEFCVQRWEAYEHIKLGDWGTKKGEERYIRLASHKIELWGLKRKQWPKRWRNIYKDLSHLQRRALNKGLTYGEIVALSGDFYDGWDALNQAPLLEIIDLLPLIHSESTTTGEFQKATGGRYLDLAEQNEAHFAQYDESLNKWRDGHVAAIAAAIRGETNEAWGLNATADHYLSDSFSGGHIRTPRKSETDGNKAHKVLNDINSKVLHDLDNKFGVLVKSERRPEPWVAYGDMFLEAKDKRNADNLEQVARAMQESKQDIVQALQEGSSYGDPEKNYNSFSAMGLLPTPVEPSVDRWAGRGSSILTESSDKSRMLIELFKKEASTVITDTAEPGASVLTWYKRQADFNQTMLARIPYSEKERMIRRLLQGTVTDTHLHAIEEICKKLNSSVELRDLQQGTQDLRDDIENEDLRRRVWKAMNPNVLWIPPPSQEH